MDRHAFVARLADGTRITAAQYEQLHRYGITTLYDGRVIDIHDDGGLVPLNRCPECGS